MSEKELLSEAKEEIYPLTINFRILKKQKLILLAMIGDWEKSDDKQKIEDAKEAEGILSLIDAIQDYAVDVLDYPEKEVFNLSEDLT